MLEVRLRKSFGSFVLDVDGRAFAGGERVLGVFGPSGSGKTTLLNCIAGIGPEGEAWAEARPGGDARSTDSPGGDARSTGMPGGDARSTDPPGGDARATGMSDRGDGDTGRAGNRILLGDRVLLDASAGIVMSPASRRIGYVLQDALLFPHMTVERNLRYGERRDAAGPGFDEVVDVLQLGDLLSRRADALSGGEARRVAIGRALLSGPKLLLLDEPLVGLDRALAGQTLHFIHRTLARFDLPAIYVTHSPSDAMFLCDRVWVLRGGRVAADGPPRQVLPRAGVMDDVDLADLENVFEAERVEGEDPASLVFRAGGARIVAATGASSAATRSADRRGDASAPTALLSIHAADIILARIAPQRISARNILPGRIIRLAPIGGAVVAFVDVGVEWMVALTPGAVAELELAEGVEVFAVVKASSVAVRSSGSAQRRGRPQRTRATDERPRSAGRSGTPRRSC